MITKCFFQFKNRINDCQHNLEIEVSYAWGCFLEYFHNILILKSHTFISKVTCKLAKMY
jgi:hypothetical protein